jgi:short-subunit dehydrogenase
MNSWWASRRVLVTGASSGIGAALAGELAKAGAVVGLCARRTALLEDVLGDCRKHVPECRAWTIDLSEIDALDRFIARVVRELGGIDVLVNNAGLARNQPATEMAWQDIEYLTRLDYLSPVRLTLAALPAMRTRGSGRIVTVSSMAARMSTPGEAAYAGAKAALAAFFEALAGELKGTGIAIHLVYPGLIDLTPGCDGEDSIADTSEPVTRVPAPVLAREILRQVERGDLELYVPHLFKEQFAQRARNVAASVEFMADWYQAGAHR